MSESRVRPWRTLAFASVLVGLPISGCDCTGNTDTDAGPAIECGAGTVEVDGECVVDPDNEPEGADGGPAIECGDGTVLNASGTACVPDLDCPEGTTENDEGTGCVLVCENPFLYDDVAAACVCALGLRPTDDGNDCEIDPALCGEGTLFQGGACVPIEAPPPADDDLNGGNPVVIELDEDKPVEVGGVVGPVDRVDGADIDVFEFVTTEAFTRVRIQLVSFGLPNGAFILSDNEGGVAGPSYIRQGISNDSNRRAVRELTLPFAGTYTIVVSDILNLIPGAPFPVGNPDADYAISIEILDSTAATAAAVDGTEYTGQHESVDAYRVETSAAPVGSILNAVLAGNDELDPTCNTVQLLWYVDGAGTYQEFGPDATCTVNALLPQPTAGIRFHVDYFTRVTGPTYDYSLAINDVPVADGPQPNDGPTDGNTGGEDLSFFRMTAEANHVYRVRAQLPNTSTLDATLLLVDASTLLAVDQGVTVTDNGIDYLEILFFVDNDEAGEYFITVADGSADSPFVEPNYNVRFSLDDAEVEFTANPTVAGAAVTNSETKPGANPFLGPWTMVRVDEIADLVIATDNEVSFRAFDPTTMGTIDGTPPALPPLPEATIGVDEGACDVNTASELIDRGDYTVTLTAPTGDFTRADWGNCSRSLDFSTDGTDFFMRLPAKPAGTVMIVEGLTAGDNATVDTNFGILETEDCTPSVDACIASDDDDGDGTRSLLEYTFTGDEGTLLLLLDSYGAGYSAGTVRFTVEFREPSGELVYQLAPGTRVLTQAFGGDSTGDFTHSADAVTSPFSWEVEPNNASGAATPLPLDADPALNGFLATGDFDWWSIEVPAAGLLTVDAAVGPLGIAGQALTMAIVDTDGTTELTSVTGGLAQSANTYVVAAGTYFVSVGATEALAAFDYTLNWSLDTDAVAPPTCEAPKLIDGPGSYDGSTAGVDLWADTGCLAADSGFPSESYDGAPDDVWTVTIPSASTIDFSATAAGDLALALVIDCEDGECLAAADQTFPGFFDPNATEQLVFTNTTDDPITALLIVTTFGTAAVDYTMEVNLVGAACFPGQSRCNGDSTALETCTADGNGYDAVACDAGCAFDDFEQVASCTAFCGEGTDKPAIDCNDDNTTVLTCAADQGRYEESDVCVAGCEVVLDVDVVTDAFCSPFCGAGTDNPDTRCNNTILETCADDQQSYNETQCAVECTDELDVDSNVVAGSCTFGLCTEFDTTVCVTETFDGFGDVAVLRDCNADASASVATSCGAGCNVAGDDCEPIPPVATPPIAVVANTGTCDDAVTLPASTLVDDSGSFTVVLNNLVANDTDGLDCNLRPGNDVFVRLDDDRPAGTTVTVTATGDADADVVLAFFSACDATCVGRVDGAGSSATETTTYTYTGNETGEVYLVIDQFFAGDEGSVDVTVAYQAPAPAICDETDNACDSGTSVATECSVGGDELDSTYCDFGCAAVDPRCADVCEGLTPESLGLGTFTVDVEPHLGDDNITRPCSTSSSGNEAIVAFTSTVDGEAFIDASVGPDIVVAVYEANCSNDDLYCGDFTESTTIDVVAGGTYYVLVENYFTTETGATTVSIEISEAP